MDELEGKIDKNTGLTQKALDEIQTTNGKVKEHDGAIKRLERRKGKRLEVNPNVIYLIALGAVILLLIVASLLHVNLGGLTK